MRSPTEYRISELERQIPSIEVRQHAPQQSGYGIYRSVRGNSHSLMQLEQALIGKQLSPDYVAQADWIVSTDPQSLAARLNEHKAHQRLREQFPEATVLCPLRTDLLMFNARELDAPEFMDRQSEPLPGPYWSYYENRNHLGSGIDVPSKQAQDPGFNADQYKQQADRTNRRNRNAADSRNVQWFEATLRKSGYEIVSDGKGPWGGFSLPYEPRLVTEGSYQFNGQHRVWYNGAVMNLRQEAWQDAIVKYSVLASIELGYQGVLHSFCKETHYANSPEAKFNANRVGTWLEVCELIQRGEWDALENEPNLLPRFHQNGSDKYNFFDRVSLDLGEWFEGNQEIFWKLRRRTSSEGLRLGVDFYFFGNVVHQHFWELIPALGKLRGIEPEVATRAFWQEISDMAQAADYCIFDMDRPLNVNTPRFQAPVGWRESLPPVYSPIAVDRPPIQPAD